jgi:enoyl-CoA hydratase|tara:strand:- start:49 stop:1011 length:963 start_codon:yes stop_codon:yes gene_type:complete
VCTLIDFIGVKSNYLLFYLWGGNKMAEYENIIYETKDAAGGKVAYVILNRPERLNALSRPLLAEFELAMNEAAKDDEVRCIIIKGNGRGFSAGYDMNVQTTGRSGERPAIESTLADGPAQMYRRAIWNNPKPVIAQVHSFTLAGGGQLACHCDITVAADNALFGYPPVRYGSVMMPMVWPELVGMKKAKEMAFTGTMIDAEEALKLNLVSQVVPTEELEERVWKLANTISKLPPASTQINKMAINHYYEQQGLFESMTFASHLTNISYSASPEVLPRGIQDVNRITEEQGMRAGFQFMNEQYLDEDELARTQMARPDRQP